MNTGKGRFIVFEGPDGAGKSTVMAEVARALRAQGREVVETREPGGSSAGEAMRQLLMQPVLQESSVLSQLLLICAARVDHLQRVIGPALQRNGIVLCDRFTDSSYIYQCRLGGVPVEQLDRLNQLLDIPAPDLRLFFTLPVDIALQRMQGRDEQNRFDRAGRAQWLQLAEAYAWRAQCAPDTVGMVDAAGPLETVVQQCLEQIDNAS